jgi:hypothetical protein
MRDLDQVGDQDHLANLYREIRLVRLSISRLVDLSGAKRTHSIKTYEHTITT